MARNSGKTLRCLLLTAAVMAVGPLDARPFRLLYWNFQNGMWDGQADDYRRFVTWVKGHDPDVCVWCEGETLYETGSDTPLKADDSRKFLPKNLKTLAARYGHAYAAVACHRDGYPQLVTSKWPLTLVKGIAGRGPNRYVVHGAGWLRLDVAGRPLNVVTLHTWPMRWDANVGREGRAASSAAGGGDRYRLAEVQEILSETVGSAAGTDGLWMMLGDFNAVSRADAEPSAAPIPSDARYLVHDWIVQKTDYVDILARLRPDAKDRVTTADGWRLDFVYVSPALAAMAADAFVVRDGFTHPVPVPDLRGFYRPSDHLPILVDFALTPDPKGIRQTD